MWTLLTVLLGGVWASEVTNMALAPPYFDHDFHNENWNLGGSSIISKSGVELTGDYPGQQGWIHSKHGDLPESFQLDIEFLLHGSARALYGDGMALWFLEDPPNLMRGPIFGVQDKIKGTALVLDTYRNHRPGKAFPYMVLSQNDGNIKYDIDNDGLANEIAGASLRGLYNPNQRPSRMRITYRRGHNIEVKVNYHNEKWETHISKPFNLNGAKWLALSASTGQLSSIHSIKGIRVQKLSDSSFETLKTEPIVEVKPTGTGSSWFAFVLKVLVFCGLLLVAPKFYRRFKRNGGNLLG